MSESRKRNVGKETFTNMGNKKQLSLSRNNYCEADHKALATQYDLKDCPSCGRKMFGQMRLGDY